VACSETIFDTTLATLNSSIDDIWADVVDRVPTILGVSFGSCYTSCGSVGITAVDVSHFALEDTTLQTSFTTCGTTNMAVLIVPIEITLDCTLALRATGVGNIWPTPDGDDGVVHSHNLNVTGNILVSVPVHNTLFEFSKVRLDVMFSGNWIGVWPDTTNILFNTVPVNELATKYMHKFNEALRGPLATGLRNALQSPDVTHNCTFPVVAPQECNVNTRTASDPCDPCDTCCMCLMQQRCDGECASCECVKCDDTKWYATMFIATILFFIISGVLIWSFVN